MTRIKEGDFVKILPPTGKDFDDDRIGQVEDVDGSYILVKRNISGVVCELYPNELRLLEGEEHDMAFFQRKLWKGLRTPKENQAWLTEGYLREVDWEADQEENVTMSYDPYSLQEDYICFPHPRQHGRGSHVQTLPKKTMCDEESIHRIGLILKKYMANKNYKNAMRFIK